MAHVNSIAEGSAEGGTAHTLTLTGVTSGNFLIVAIRYSSTFSFTDVASDQTGSGNGGVFTKLFTGTEGTVLEVWYLENAAAGTHVITATASASGQTIRWGAAAYDSVPTSSVIEDWENAAFTTTTTVTTNAVTTTGTDRVIVSIVMTDASATSVAPNGGETERFEVEARFQLQDEAAATAGNYDASWSLGATQLGEWAILALKAAAAGGSLVLPQYDRMFRQNTLLRM